MVDQTCRLVCPAGEAGAKVLDGRPEGGMRQRESKGSGVRFLFDGVCVCGEAQVWGTLGE